MKKPKQNLVNHYYLCHSMFILLLFLISEKHKALTLKHGAKYGAQQLTKRLYLAEIPEIIDVMVGGCMYVTGANVSEPMLRQYRRQSNKVKRLCYFFAS